MKLRFGLFLGLLIIITQVSAQFAPPAGQEGSSAISADSSCFVAWAISCSIERGYVNISEPKFEYSGTPFASYGSAEDAVGKADGQVVSLGDGGVAILEFDPPIANGDSWDFVVFENALNDVFLELAFVEVSSDGVNYFRFPAVSLTQTEEQIAGFGEIDATKINNLAGKYRAPYGTPFDLDDLEDNPLLDKNNVKFVKIIDVVGSIDPQFATYDSQGNIVNDPFPTPFHSSGFDLDAVGVIINSLNTNISDDRISYINIYPNPVSNILNISGLSSVSNVQIFNILGDLVLETNSIGNNIDVSTLLSGVYILKITSNFRVRQVTKIIIENN